MLTWQRHGLECRRSLGEYVVSTLVKSWGFSDALQVFTGFLWTARLWFLGKPPSWGTPRQAKAGGLENVSLQIFSPSSGCSRLVCGSLSDLEEGKRIHDDVLKYRVKQTKTSLLYEMMRVEGPSPTDGTCVGVLQSCACSQIWTKMLQVVTDQEECAGKGTFHHGRTIVVFNDDAAKSVSLDVCAGSLWEARHGISGDRPSWSEPQACCCVHFDVEHVRPCRHVEHQASGRAETKSRCVEESWLRLDCNEVT